MAVGLLYKWEEHNHGLEHKCGTCATVLSSCLNTIKAHAKRHLEIAELTQAIHRLEGTVSIDSPLCNKKRKGKKRNEPNRDASGEIGVHVDGVDQAREVEWDSTSSTLINDDEAKERKQCWAGAMENADARKAAKAERKAAKNQVLFDIITQEELAKVEKALHAESDLQASAASKHQGLADNQTIDENIAFNANTFKWSTLRQAVHAKKIARSNGGKQKPNTPQEDNEILNPIFAALGISTKVSKASKERKALNARLRTAVLADLVAFENDQVETMQRMAGYWRYANRRTYNGMVRNNQLWDWATGEKLPEIREEGELDVIDEEDENIEAGTLDGDREMQFPENWDDEDFGLLDGKTALSLDALINRMNNNGTDGRSDTLAMQSHVEGDMKLDEESGEHLTLSSSPGRLSRENLSLKILSPISGNGDWELLQDEFEGHTKTGFETSDSSPTPRSPLSPLTSNPHEKGFQGVKDTRVFGKAIRKASLPSKDTSPAPQPFQNLLAPATKDKVTPDLLNRFGALNNEVPAPCEEVKKVDSPLAKSVVKIPAQPIIKTLVIHNEQDDFKTVHRSKGKKGAKGGPVIALREQAAANVHAKKLARGKSFAAAVKKGL